jgi:hypothetical protein
MREHKAKPYTIEDWKGNVLREVSAVSQTDFQCVNANFIRICQECEGKK